MASKQRERNEPIGSSPPNATTFRVHPRELGVATGDAPEQVDVDLRLPLEIHIRTPKRQFRFEFEDPSDDEVVYVGVPRSSLLKDREPQCVPGWMPAVMAHVGFDIADSGVKR